MTIVCWYGKVRAQSDLSDKFDTRTLRPRIDYERNDGPAYE